MATLFQDPVLIQSDYGTLDLIKTVTHQVGAVISCDILDGWDDTPEPRVEVSEYGFADGVEVAEKLSYSEKYLEMGGWVHSPNRATALAAAEVLKSILRDHPSLKVTRFEPTGAKFMRVRAISKLSIPSKENIGDQGFRWYISLMAPWPFKLGQNPSVGIGGAFSRFDYYRTYDLNGTDLYRTYAVEGSLLYRTYQTPNEDGTVLDSAVTINNAGNADAWPVFQVVGPLSVGQWFVTNETTGESITFNLGVGVGQTLTIDNLRHEALLEGASVGYFLRGTWLRAVPGDNVFRLTSIEPSPSARLSVSSWDTSR